MCKILLSIKPEYIENILAGNKKFEYRKRICKREVDKIIFYATSPVCMVVAEASVKNILNDSINYVWKKTKNYSGITYDFYNHYFANSEFAVAYELFKVKKYKRPIPLSKFGVNFPPQSYVYV